jgi:hypothetical protein
MFISTEPVAINRMLPAWGENLLLIRFGATIIYSLLSELCGSSDSWSACPAPI